MGLDPTGAIHLEASAGTRSAIALPSGVRDRQRWQDGSVDIGLGRRCFITAGTEHDLGSSGSLWQHTAGMSWRF